jgi:hypothetical protein
MPIVKTKLDDTTYQDAVRMRIAAGLPSVSALFLERCGLLTDETEAREIVKQASARAKKKPKGAEFRLRDLFKPDVWNQFSKGARLRAGKLFHSKVARAVDGIRMGKTSGAGHQFYEVA